MLSSSKAKPKKKPNKIRALKKRAWRAISVYIRQRDPWCVTCGQNATRDCGHYRHNSERNQELGGNALWYDERNLNGQCVSCNKWHSGALDRYAIYLQAKHGYGILEEIQRLYTTPKKWTVEEIQALTAKYEGLAFNRVIR